MNATSHMYATMYTTCVYVHNVAQMYNVKTQRVYVYNVYMLIVYNDAQVYNYVYNAAQFSMQSRTCMQRRTCMQLSIPRVYMYTTSHKYTTWK